MSRRVKGPDGVIHEFPDDATDAEISAALERRAPVKASGTANVAPERSWLGTAGEVGKGIAKGAAASVAGLGEMAVNAGMVPGSMPAAFQPEFRHPVFGAMDEVTRAENTPQTIGKGIETAAEIAVPAMKGAQAIPSAARAGRAFQNVMGAAKNVPVNVEAPGQVGLRIMQLAERGGTMPRPVNQFLQWVTNPSRDPMTYEVARDFASNISRLSANEMQRLTPTMAREVAELRVTLNKAVAEAASKVGKGHEYSQAMTEYAKAMKLRGLIDDVVSGAQRAAPWAAAAGAGTWITSKMLNLFGK